MTSNKQCNTQPTQETGSLYASHHLSQQRQATPTNQEKTSSQRNARMPRRMASRDSTTWRSSAGQLQLIRAAMHGEETTRSNESERASASVRTPMATSCNNLRNAMTCSTLRLAMSSCNGVPSLNTLHTKEIEQCKRSGPPQLSRHKEHANELPGGQARRAGNARKAG